LDFSKNWWGTTEEYYYVTKIYDYNFNYILPRVTYLPYSLSPSNFSDLSPSNGTLSLKKPDGSYWGTIEEDYTFQYDTNPYIIGGTLTVKNGIVLTVEAGVEFQFVQSAGAKFDLICHFIFDIFLQPSLSMEHSMQVVHWRKKFYLLLHR
jgi:hypothetical protein